MKNILKAALVAVVIATMPALAGAIKTWASGDTLTSADLNANFQHIHNVMVGGHGARLVDADVSTSANISSSKLAGYRQMPRAWGSVAISCSSNPCTLISSNNITSITRSGTGAYVVTLAYTATNTAYTILAQGYHHVATTQIYCQSTEPTSTTTFSITCEKDDATNADSGFSFVVFDND